MTYISTEKKPGRGNADSIPLTSTSTSTHRGAFPPLSSNPAGLQIDVSDNVPSPIDRHTTRERTPIDRGRRRRNPIERRGEEPGCSKGIIRGGFCGGAPGYLSRGPDGPGWPQPLVPQNPTIYHNTPENPRGGDGGANPGRVEVELTRKSWWNRGNKGNPPTPPWVEAQPSRGVSKRG